MASDARDAGKQAMAPNTKQVAVAKIGPSKMATTMPSNNHVMGTVTFTQSEGKVLIVTDLTGLQPNSTHGIHIHERGDLTSADLSSAGGHFDPGNTHHHGDPANPGSGIHAGDLGNIKADANGNAHSEMTVDNLTISGTTNPIVGKSVIIHAKNDNLTGQPSGDSGGRIAGGVIERTSQQ